DIARMGHQQQVMSAIVKRAKSSEVLTRPDRLYGFLDAVTSSLTVDEDLNSLSALASLATDAANVDDSNISFRVMPREEEPTDHNRVIPSAEAAEVFQRLHADQPLDGEGEAAADDQASSADQDTADGTTAGDSDAGASGAGESDSTTAQPDGQQGED
ncbi:LCP family protein, partial [Bacillus subtilis]|uniref:LCP family protein n=1 Tax=Bacillus subtilis TaxID=1423 RepID=UPI00397EECD1